MQRKHAELEHARDAFSETMDVVYVVDSIYRQFKHGQDFYGRLHHVDGCIAATEAAPLRLFVPVDVRSALNSERPPVLKVSSRHCCALFGECAPDATGLSGLFRGDGSQRIVTAWFPAVGIPAAC
jgi:hypothetical protein